MFARPVVSGQCLNGIDDSIVLIRESLAALVADKRSYTVTPTQLVEVLDAMAPLVHRIHGDRPN